MQKKKGYENETLGKCPCVQLNSKLYVGEITLKGRNTWGQLLDFI